MNPILNPSGAAASSAAKPLEFCGYSRVSAPALGAPPHEARSLTWWACCFALATTVIGCSNAPSDGTAAVAKAGPNAAAGDGLSDGLSDVTAAAADDGNEVADAPTGSCGAACPPNSTCEKSSGICQCADGYKKDKDGIKCVQLKTCDPDNKPTCGKHAHCQLGAPAKDATCACDDGLEGDAFSVEIGCNKNLLECLKGLDKCDHESTKCVEKDPLDPTNPAGLPYECTCLSDFGFTVQATSVQCKCPIGKKIDAGACVCKDGFEANGQGGCKAKCAGGCAVDAECGADKCGNSCGTCAANSACDVSKCKCNDGYAKGAAGTCVAINVCGTANQTKVCDKNATCKALAPGTNDCECNPGYDSTPNGGCVLGDKCKVTNGGCSANASCVMDLAGAVTCTCKDGFKGDGKGCADVDECALGNGGCSVNAKCSNSAGAFSCACKVGYQGDGKDCSDVDECAAQISPCAKAGVCTNQDGGFTCACAKGWAGDGKTCVDVDECKTNNGNCGANSTCYNTAGDYECPCVNGYTGSGKLASVCADIDECKNGSAACDKNAKCTNLPGSVKCECLQGYKGDGFQCALDKSCNPLCDQNASCVGGDVPPYVCKCNSGFSGNGQKCFPIPVTITMQTVTINPVDPNDNLTWDGFLGGSTLSAEDKAKFEKLLKAAAAAAGLPEFVIPAVTSLITFLVGVINPPDPYGTVMLTSPGKSSEFELLEQSNTLHPAWNGVTWKGITLDATVQLKLDLWDADASVPDQIGLVSISYAEILKVFQFGKPAPIMVKDQGKGGILFVEVSVTPAYVCGNSNCDASAGETATNCPTDCKSEINCTDKLDNDGDGKIDCADSDCAADPACAKVSSCKGDYPLTCEDNDSYNSDGVGSTNGVDSYSCKDSFFDVAGQTGSEYTYDFTSDCTGTVTVTVTKKNLTDGKFLGLFILDGTKICDGKSCAAHGSMATTTAKASFSAKLGQKFFIVVDGYQGYAGGYDVTTSCVCK